MAFTLVACDTQVFNQKKFEDEIQQQMDNGEITKEEADIINSVDLDQTAKDINGDDWVEDESMKDVDINLKDLGIDTSDPGKTAESFLNAATYEIE